MRILLALCLTLAAGAALAAPALEMDFEEGIDGVTAKVFYKDKEKGERFQEYEGLTVTHETEDTAAGSKGALRLTQKDMEARKFMSHQTGAQVKAGRFEKGQTLKITFAAKSVSGSKNLSILRIFGGAKGDHVIQITDEWAEYEVVLDLGFKSSVLVINLVKIPRDTVQPCVDGVVLIDNLAVEVVEPEAAAE